MPVKAQTGYEMQKANHGELHLKSKIFPGRGPYEAWTSEQMYEDIHIERRE